MNTIEMMNVGMRNTVAAIIRIPRFRVVRDRCFSSNAYDFFKVEIVTAGFDIPVRLDDGVVFKSIGVVLMSETSYPISAILLTIDSALMVFGSNTTFALFVSKLTDTSLIPFSLVNADSIPETQELQVMPLIER